MAHALKTCLTLTAALALIGGAAMAQPDHHPGPSGGAPAGAPKGGAPKTGAKGPPKGEPHPGPSGYARVTAPQGWNARPTTVNKPALQHNFQAARSFQIGPYHPPRGWQARTWTYGQILPRAYWASPYILADYWLFALEVPPVDCEWVRDGADAILVDTDTGEILQVEYGVFA